jgi:hypothetical protein
MILRKYAVVNEERWKQAAWLTENFPGVSIIPLYPFDYKDQGKAGKVPMINGWPKKGPTTPEEIEEWMRWDGGFCNTGMVLGGIFAAIDVDGGEKGLAILDELSAGDLPETVAYRTPGGGYRYLYLVREGLHGKALKKYSKPGQGEHIEVALLGTGQQTVLPFSIHPNGGTYECLEGKSFYDHSPAYMPGWMETLMLRQEPAKKAKAGNGKNVSPSADLKALIKQTMCRYLQDKLEEQIKTGLSEQDWFHVMLIFIGAGLNDEARQFSAIFEEKYDDACKKRIEDLSEQEERGKIRCQTLGCDEKMISECSKRLRFDEAGGITNSPVSKLKRAVRDMNKHLRAMADAGLEYDRNGNARVNPSRFVRHFISLHKIRVINGRRAKDCQYYLYIEKKGYWRETPPVELCTLMRKALDEQEPDLWKKRMGEEFMEALAMESPSISGRERKRAREYVNVKNGHYHLKKRELLPHDEDIFSTVQIPVVYEPDAKCPEFMGFLESVFLGDESLIQVATELLGYCLTTSVKAEKVFFLVGEGSNGKSVFCKVLRALAGSENASALRLEDFSDKFSLSTIVNKLVNIAPESEHSRC